MNNRRYDVAVIGAGAAGMMAAAVAGQRGLRVLLIDHARRLGEKIRIWAAGGATLPIVAPRRHNLSRKTRIFAARRWPLIPPVIFWT